ncbi:pyruvate carboxylase [Facklamia sp. DSM 111018]|uniref:Pyruvate carboxylase n=1 Tax=Facklamia lactis TaxID=2749967 RepID=A0ABS0LQ60_9LACT|nr:pyruvate carboxylase [Facklamia lactis]MBG9979876.1 pyruvate carboxylase [Facklamia lactis]MBG9985444.1 pyruvate carboxylase [Facklamia lactis]
MNKIKKVLIANRGEIAIRIIRACKELNLSTVAIFSKEDLGTLHRQKADESYLIGEELDPTQAYLDIEGIIELAKEKNVDAIHPGYGFLSENQTFAKRCQEEGIIFIGPDIKHLNMFGNKTSARETAIQAGIPVVPGSDGEITCIEEAEAFAEEHGYPIILKAVSGGGGKGMRIVENHPQLLDAYERVKSEAKKSFANEALYVEKYIANPKHIEVQIIGDHYGNVIHLYERDCSIQRRHQKVVEVAPSFNLPENMRQKLTDASLHLMKNIQYVNAGTVEFLVTEDNFYFIEVNPRVQVEHTITELVTGIDIVKSQILIADGESLYDEVLDFPSQEEIPLNGYAIQCRITTEDPLNNFAPDSGNITGYQSPGGYGVRLDAGDAFTGAKISPYYDSLLVKISTYSASPKGAIDKMRRALSETKVRGLKTNLLFLQNIMFHEDFITGEYSTNFIDTRPELFEIIPSRDRGSKLLNYIGNVTVNGFPGIANEMKPDFAQRIKLKSYSKLLSKDSFKSLLENQGPTAVIEQILQEKNVLLTDTTLRDAHQSLISTRLRTTDMLGATAYMNTELSDYFSFEMWGGATFDVAYNFLKESPWDRLTRIRQTMPDSLLQMLFRASNAVGYSNYPDNVVQRFIHESAKQGIDVFRIFDSLNWLEAMKVSIDAALETGKLVEGTICYTGDILDPNRSQIYTLDYYVQLAKKIEALGVHLLAIKDMSGILKPEAAFQLIKALKSEINIPIHLHTHDTSGNAIAMYSRAIDAGVDIVDVANEAFSGLTSQPNASSLFVTRQGTDRQILTNIKANEKLADYWKVTRSYYQPFESKLKSPWPSVYEYEMPGGQYTNFQFQASSLGLGERFEEVLDMYKRVNQLLGDITKVTPSSKVVGDLALFMVQNDLDEESVISQGHHLDFPASVVEFMRGDIGQPPAGMNSALQKVVLKQEEAYTIRPGELLEDYDFEKVSKHLNSTSYVPVPGTIELSYALYPKVVQQFIDFVENNGLIWNLSTPIFFYGMAINETIAYELEPGKTLVIELINIGPTKADGYKTVHFEINGLNYRTEIPDLSFEGKMTVNPKADKGNPHHIAASMPGSVAAVTVKVGDNVEQNQVLLVTEAMKMENSIQAPKKGKIKAIYAEVGAQVAGGDLLIELEN